MAKRANRRRAATDASDEPMVSTASSPSPPPEERAGEKGPLPLRSGKSTTVIRLAPSAHPTARLKSDLVRAASRAREGAVAPYSKFKVGAALLTRSGEVITGANVESASYGLTCCAERVALFQALTQGRRDFIAIAVVARTPGGAMPCGACRQLLAEYARNAAVWVADSRALKAVREFTVQSLMPGAFVGAALKG